MAKRRRHGNPAIAVAYIRVSTEDQRLGPEAQRASIEAWAAHQGVTVAAWHTDHGVSGGADLADRPALAAALADLRAHGAGLLLVAKRDRLARDVVIAATVERAAAQAGATIVSADGAGNGDTPADALMRTMLDAFSAYERAIIRARTKAALGAKRARGERAGEVPYGFAADANGRLAPDPAEQTVIAQVHALRAAGLSMRGIVAELDRAGLVSRTGKPLALTQVARVLRTASNAIKASV